jgi:hypothetical protein
MVERSMGMQFTPPADFRVGDAFARSFRLYSDNFTLFTAVTFITTIPTLIYSIAFADPNAQAQANPGATSSDLIWLGIEITLLAVIPFAAAHCLINIMTLDRINRRRRPLGASVMAMVFRLPPVVGTVIILYVSMGTAAVQVSLIYLFIRLTIGQLALLLIAPVMIWLAMISVALPVCAVEKRNPFGAVWRSRALTKTHRLKVSVAYLVPVLAWEIGQHLLYVFLVASFGPAIGTVITAPAGTILDSYFAVLVLVIYHDLAVAKGEMPGASFAEVFD